MSPQSSNLLEKRQTAKLLLNNSRHYLLHTAKRNLRNGNNKNNIAIQYTMIKSLFHKRILLPTNLARIRVTTPTAALSQQQRIRFSHSDISFRPLSRTNLNSDQQDEEESQDYKSFKSQNEQLSMSTIENLFQLLDENYKAPKLNLQKAEQYSDKLIELEDVYYKEFGEIVWKYTIRAYVAKANILLENEEYQKSLKLRELMMERMRLIENEYGYLGEQSYRAVTLLRLGRLKEALKDANHVLQEIDQYGPIGIVFKKQSSEVKAEVLYEMKEHTQFIHLMKEMDKHDLFLSEQSKYTLLFNMYEVLSSENIQDKIELIERIISKYDNTSFRYLRLDDLIAARQFEEAISDYSDVIKLFKQEPFEPSTPARLLDFTLKYFYASFVLSNIEKTLKIVEEFYNVMVQVRYTTQKQLDDMKLLLNYSKFFFLVVCHRIEEAQKLMKEIDLVVGNKDTIHGFDYISVRMECQLLAGNYNEVINTIGPVDKNTSLTLLAVVARAHAMLGNSSEAQSILKLTPSKHKIIELARACCNPDKQQVIQQLKQLQRSSIDTEVRVYTELIKLERLLNLKEQEQIHLRDLLNICPQHSFFA
jgi:tetratricopeptide (TPR) repeat protein